MNGATNPGDTPLFSIAGQGDPVTPGRHETAAAALLAHAATDDADPVLALVASMVLAAARAVDVAETAAALTPTVAAARAISTTTRTLAETLAAAGIVTGPAPARPAPAPSEATPDPFAALVAALSGDDADPDA